MACVKLGITEYVDCAHHLPGHPKCGRPHGHTYKVDVQIEGEVKGGMVLDFAELRAAVRGVLASYDHGCWNDVLDYPSVEKICELLHTKLQEALHYPLQVRVWEGEDKWAEI